MDLKELDEWLGTAKKIKLSSGREVELKQLKWRDELRIGQIIGNILADAYQTEETNALKIAVNLLNEMPDKVVELIKLTTNLSDKEIEDLSLEEVVEVILPSIAFFLTKSQKIMDSKIRPILDKLKVLQK